MTLSLSVLVFLSTARDTARIDPYYAELARHISSMYVVGRVSESSKLHNFDSVTVIEPPKYVPLVMFAVFFSLVNRNIIRSIDIVRITAGVNPFPGLLLSMTHGDISLLCTLPIDDPPGRMHSELIGAFVTRIICLFADAVVSPSAVRYLTVQSKHWVRAKHFVIHPPMSISPSTTERLEERPVALILDSHTLRHFSTWLSNISDKISILLISTESAGCTLHSSFERVSPLEWRSTVDSLLRYDLVVLAVEGRRALELTVDVMGSGIPIVTSETGEIREFITNGQNGLVLPEEEDLIQQSVFRLLHDDSTKEQLGETAIITACETWDVSRNFQQELGIYCTLAHIK